MSGGWALTNAREALLLVAGEAYARFAEPEPARYREGWLPTDRNASASSR